MRVRVRKLLFIPTSVNFSSLPEGHENDFVGNDTEEILQDQIDKEILLLQTIRFLDSDKERCVLLLEILREYGFQIDYSSIAKSLKIELRWLMRVKKNVHKKVQTITTNA